MAWTEAFLVLLLAHVIGDFLLQTEFQATNKVGGLGRDPVSRRALLSHLATYSAPMAAALLWLLLDDVGVGRALLAMVVALGTHLVQDDGRLLKRYVLAVKHTDAQVGTPLWIAIDQSAHFVWLALAAIVAAG